MFSFFLPQISFYNIIDNAHKHVYFGFKYTFLAYFTVIVF